MARITYDATVNAAYIYLISGVGQSSVEKTVQLGSGPYEIGVDFGHDGMIIGIEVLNASKYLTEEMLEQAEKL